jgi:hypothetical protein
MPSMGGGAADGLQQVLQRLFLETQVKQAAAERDRDAQRQIQRDAEAGQRWQSDFDLRKAAQERLVGLDKTRADQESADRLARQGAADVILNDPLVPLPTRNLLRLTQHGLGSNLNVHALESPDAHQAHLSVEQKADDDREFEAWRRQQDYSDKLQRGRTAAAANLRMRPADDRELPAGVQAHLAQIRSRHGDFEGALAEFINSVDAHRQAHPSFQPQQAVDALRNFYVGGGKPASDPLSMLLQGGGVSAETRPPQRGMVTATGKRIPLGGGGRGAGPGVRPSAAQTQRTRKPVPGGGVAELQPDGRWIRVE